jgi:hypothetical protein
MTMTSISDFDLDELRELMGCMTPHERSEVHALLAQLQGQWLPLPGPQTDAALSEAEIIGYGGAAGGGKTALAVGLALSEHTKSLIVRQHAKELKGIYREIGDQLGTNDGHSKQEATWTHPKGFIDFGSLKDPGDEQKLQGQDHDLLVIDEAVNCRASQVRFIMGWVRSTTSGQRQRILLTFNPPTDAEGRWVVEFFAPWLDPLFPNPAKVGEIRWAASLPADDMHPNGRDVWVDDGREFIIDHKGDIVYNFDRKTASKLDIIKPQSRTFIAARITDNPYLMGTGYMNRLQGLPEPLRSQMLKGDFTAGMQDDPWQVIPTAWVEAAMDRWQPFNGPKPKMTSMGVDCNRGGPDKMVIARLHGNWYDEPLDYPGSQVPDGPVGAGLVLTARRNVAPVHVDLIGVGSSVYDHLKTNNTDIYGINVGTKARGTSREGNLEFGNYRSEIAWRMREALDPNNETLVALPPHPMLKADLCALRWEFRGGKIWVIGKEALRELLQRSIDFGDAYMLANIQMPPMKAKVGSQAATAAAEARRNYRPGIIRNR